MVSVFGFYGFRRGRKTIFMVSVAGILVDAAAAGGSKILDRIERFLVFCVFRTGFHRWFVYGFRRGRKTLFYGFRHAFLMVSVVARNVFVWFPSLVFLWFPAATGPRLFSPMETVKEK